MFKNLQVYGFDTKISCAALEEELRNIVFSACPSNRMLQRGWTSPLPHDEGNEALIYAAGNRWLICMREEKRLLPASVVKQHLQAECDKLAAKQGYPVSRKTQRELKDRVIETLMPRAFVKSTKTWAWIDAKAGFIGIDASSRSAADKVIELLGKSCSKLPVLPLVTQVSPVAKMTDLLLGTEVAGITVDRECELRNPEKGIIAYKKHLLSDEVAPKIAEHLSEGKLPTKLALTWRDRLSFVLTEKFEIKRLALLDSGEDEGDDAEDAESAFAADFEIMSGVFSEFLPAMIDVLGGLESVE